MGRCCDRRRSLDLISHKKNRSWSGGENQTSSPPTKALAGRIPRSPFVRAAAPLARHRLHRGIGLPWPTEAWAPTAQTEQLANGSQAAKFNGMEEAKSNPTVAPKTSGEITRLLRAWSGGRDEARDELWPILYGELKNLARTVGRNRGAQDQPTSLVHKAYLRLLDSDVEWNDRRHFFAIAARAMRFVLTDEARRQLANKRGSGETLNLGDELPRVVDPQKHRPEEVLAVHQALVKLAEIRPRQAKLVEMRYFAGLSIEETADILEVTPRTAARDWRTAQIWLHGELKATG